MYMYIYIVSSIYVYVTNIQKNNNMFSHGLPRWPPKVGAALKRGPVYAYKHIYTHR